MCRGTIVAFRLGERSRGDTSISAQRPSDAADTEFVIYQASPTAKFVVTVRLRVTDERVDAPISRAQTISITLPSGQAFTINELRCWK